MWSDFRGGGLRGGLDPPSAECPQPVHTVDRDALRTRIGEWTGPWDVDHVAEGHPDIKAAWNDIRGRLRGLYDRPLLLRCSKEARDRADRWLGQLQELCNAVKSDGRNCAGYTRVPAAFSFTVFRGPTYTIRASNHPDVSRAQQAFAGNAPPATVAPVSSAPPGSVVIDGQVYASSAAAAAASPAPASTTQEATAPEAGGVVPTAGGASAWIPPAAAGAFNLEGSIAGIPTKYLVYGALGLLAYRMVK
jgi:hypothetical protein